MEDPDAKHSLTYQEPADLSVGGEDREGPKTKLVTDVWNRDMRNLWRSDAGISIN